MATKKLIDGKPWYMSKTIWASIVTAAVAILMTFGVAIPVEVLAALGALGLYGLRTAEKPIK